jgi:hypothetical protein
MPLEQLNRGLTNPTWLCGSWPRSLNCLLTRKALIGSTTAATLATRSSTCRSGRMPQRTSKKIQPAVDPTWPRTVADGTSPSASSVGERTSANDQLRTATNGWNPDYPPRGSTRKMALEHRGKEKRTCQPPPTSRPLKQDYRGIGRPPTQVPMDASAFFPFPTSCSASSQKGTPSPRGFPAASHFKYARSRMASSGSTCPFGLGSAEARLAVVLTVAFAESPLGKFAVVFFTGLLLSRLQM